MASVCSVYHPSQLDEKRFWDRELTRGQAGAEIPSGFPRRLDSSLAWTGEEVEKKESQWRLDLTAGDIVAIDAAIATFESKLDDLSSISASTFQLPDALSQRLKEVSDQVYQGVGFHIIRGIDPSRYTPRQSAIVYAGISSHIFPQRGYVDADHGVIGHVVNVTDGRHGHDIVSTAPASSNVPLSFHTDNCEILSFFYLETAMRGGRTILSSSWETYNELALNRPEVLQTLAEPWMLDTFKSHQLMAPYEARFLQKTTSNTPPILFRFSRYPMTGWQRKRDIELARPTQKQLEALDAVQFTAMKNSFKLPVVRGDMSFVNDLSLFHAREGFEDGESERHLLKMYLRDPEQGWSLPPSLVEQYGLQAVYGTDSSQDVTRHEKWNVCHKVGLEELLFHNG